MIGTSSVKKKIFSLFLFNFFNRANNLASSCGSAYLIWPLPFHKYVSCIRDFTLEISILSTWELDIQFQVRGYSVAPPALNRATPPIPPALVLRAPGSGVYVRAAAPALAPAPAHSAAKHRMDVKINCPQDLSLNAAALCIFISLFEFTLQFQHWILSVEVGTEKKKIIR